MNSKTPMTRFELINRLAMRQPSLSLTDTGISVRLILDAISQSLAAGGRAEIRGFGSFSLNYRPPRKGRNPKTGQQVNVPAKYVPHFKAGKEMRDRVNKRA